MSEQQRRIDAACDAIHALPQPTGITNAEWASIKCARICDVIAAKGRP